MKTVLRHARWRCAPVRSFVVAAREDIQIAAQVRAVLAAGVH